MEEIIKQGLESVQPTIDMSKAINDHGMTTVSAAAFLIYSFIVLTVVITQFVLSIVDNRKLKKSVELLVADMNLVTGQQKQILESFANEELSRIRGLMHYALDSNKHAVCVTVIGQIKEKNGIDNKAAVEKKVRGILSNIYKRLKTDLSEYEYKGKKLSDYCLDEWLEMVFEYCMEAIYDGQEYHRDVYLRGLTILFDRIKIEFFENLNKK